MVTGEGLAADVALVVLLGRGVVNGVTGARVVLPADLKADAEHLKLGQLNRFSVRWSECARVWVTRWA